jgi:N-acyl homoserine lactone hydrolase
MADLDTPIRLYALHCGGEEADIAAFDPFDKSVGTTIKIPWFCFLITHPRGNVLFDTGGHPSLAVDARGRLGAHADLWSVTMRAGDDVASKLAEVGLRPSDIRYVVISHLHYDHAGGLQFFSDAEIYIQREELRFAYSPPVYQGGYIRGDFDCGLKWHEIEGDHDLFGDGTVTLVHTPGHTPGHQCLLVRLRDQTLLLLGDAAYIIQKMHDRRLPARYWNPDALIASWERIEELETQLGAELLAAHELSYETKIRCAPQQWYE